MDQLMFIDFKLRHFNVCYYKQYVTLLSIQLCINTAVSTCNCNGQMFWLIFRSSSGQCSHKINYNCMLTWLHIIWHVIVIYFMWIMAWRLPKYGSKHVSITFIRTNSNIHKLLFGQSCIPTCNDIHRLKNDEKSSH